MISLIGVALAWLVRTWLPPDPRVRLAHITGRHGRALDDRMVAWWRARQSRKPGQVRTTLLLEMLMGELLAGLIPERAFTHVLGSQYATPADVLAVPPTADAHIWNDVAHVWAACEEAGFSMAGALRRIHAYALVDQEVSREVQSTAAAPKFAVLTVIAMPAVAWMLAGSVGARPLAFLLQSPFGWACLAVTVLLDSVAVLWMARLVKRATT